MGDFTKVNGVADASINKVDGVAASDISKVSGVTKGAAGSPTASKWIAAGAQAKVWRTTVADASSGWEKIADLGSGNLKSITIGQDNSGNKRWVIHSTNSSREVSYVNDGDEVADPNTSVGNWTLINMSNNHLAVDGGPSIAWGNNYWVGSGDDVAINPAPSDEDVLFVSGDGGGSWTTVELAAQQLNDVGRTACYKDGTTFFFTVQDTIWKATADPSNASNWNMILDLDGGQDIMAMAYNGSDLWVAVGLNGEVHTSDDDWASATERTGGHSTSNINGVVYCGGTVNKWVSVGLSGKIAYSSDGIDWTAATTGTTQHLRAVATDNTTIVVVGAAGTILTSTDAVNWSSITNSTGTQIWSVTCDIIGSGMR
tara:strand:- start:283 stop:1395 length:1113 start_codon:yes stop_codon:yes gene_type:complete